MTYLKIRNFSVDLKEEIDEFSIGLDGLPYAVFRDDSYAWEYAEYLFGTEFVGKITCFGHYENAVLLQETIGL